MTLPASAAERRAAAPAIDQCLLPMGHSAANRCMPLLLSIDGTYRQMDRHDCFTDSALHTIRTVSTIDNLLNIK